LSLKKAGCKLKLSKVVWHVCIAWWQLNVHYLKSSHIWKKIITANKICAVVQTAKLCLGVGLLVRLRAAPHQLGVINGEIIISFRG